MLPTAPPTPAEARPTAASLQVVKWDSATPVRPKKQAPKVQKRTDCSGTQRGADRPRARGPRVSCRVPPHDGQVGGDRVGVERVACDVVVAVVDVLPEPAEGREGDEQAPEREADQVRGDHGFGIMAESGRPSTRRPQPDHGTNCFIVNHNVSNMKRSGSRAFGRGANPTHEDRSRAPRVARGRHEARGSLSNGGGG